MACETHVVNGDHRPPQQVQPTAARRRPDSGGSDARTAFVAKIGVYSHDIQSGTSRYFEHLKELSGHQTINCDDISMYMPEMKSGVLCQI